MTHIVSTGLRGGHPYTITATIDDAEIARRKAAAEARRNPVQTTISASDFFNRFTPDEHAAVWSAATDNPAIGVGLTQGLAAGRIYLTSAALKVWMDGLVAVGAITIDRETAILTP